MRPDLHLDEHDDQPAESMAISVDIDASIETVWLALTTEAGLATWMGQGATIEGRPGGVLTLPDMASGRPRQGFIEDIEPGERLLYRWWPADEPEAATTVAISVEEVASGTRVTVVETAPAASTSSACASHARAAWVWRTALLALAVSLVATH